MKSITKTFVEIYCLDMEGRCGWWKTFNNTHENAIAQLGPMVERVRTVEKTFDPETFAITIKVLRETKKVYDGLWWTGETEEVV